MALSPAQLEFVEALFVFKKQVLAAQCVGISDGTACRWWKLPEVRAEFDRIRTEARDLTIAHLQTAGPEAVAVLVQLLASPDPGIAGKAAVDLLRNFWKGTETEDILAEARRLREQVEQLTNAGTGGDASAEESRREPPGSDPPSTSADDALPG